MPRRTNEFQKLVSLIQRALAPKGAKVTDSALVRAPGLEGFREIDVLIEGTFGPYRMKVAVEAKGIGRPLELSAFQSIEGKYFGKSGIPVNKVVVVAANGFTADVVRNAKLHDITLLTLKEAKEANWAKTGPVRMRFMQTPHICGVAFHPSIKTRAHGPLLSNAHVTCPHGHDLGVLGKYLGHLVSCHVQPQRPTLMKELYERARQEPNGQAVAIITLPMDEYVIRIGGRDHRVKTLTFRIHAVDAVGTAHCAAYELTSAEGSKNIVQHIKASLGGKNLEILLPKGIQSPRVALNITSGVTEASASGQEDVKRRQRPEGKRDR